MNKWNIPLQASPEMLEKSQFFRSVFTWIMFFNLANYIAIVFYNLTTCIQNCLCCKSFAGAFFFKHTPVCTMQSTIQLFSSILLSSWQNTANYFQLPHKYRSSGGARYYQCQCTMARTHRYGCIKPGFTFDTLACPRLFILSRFNHCHLQIWW